MYTYLSAGTLFVVIQQTVTQRPKIKQQAVDLLFHITLLKSTRLCGNHIQGIDRTVEVHPTSRLLPHHVRCRKLHIRIYSFYVSITVAKIHAALITFPVTHTSF